MCLTSLSKKSLADAIDNRKFLLHMREPRRHFRDIDLDEAPDKSNQIMAQMANYTAHNYSQMILLPISLEDQLMPGTLEWAIHELVEHRLETSIFDAKYANDDTGAPAYPPKSLLKIVLLFAYTRGLVSSRQIEHHRKWSQNHQELSIATCLCIFNEQGDTSDESDTLISNYKAARYLSWETDHSWITLSG